MKNDLFQDYENRRIVLIEYAGQGRIWMPHSVFVHDAPDFPHCFSTYDFTWSKTHGSLYYHESGSGGPPYVNGWPGAKKTHAKLWWDQEASPILETGGGQVITSADLPSLGFELISEPLILDNDAETNPFIYGIEMGVICCTKCQDWLPEDEPCNHVFWCEKCGVWGGAASDKEGCRHRKPTN
jgi:hypothetical protein